MKKIFFVLPLSVLLTYCSSTRPAVQPGVSNVQVNGETVTDASMATNNNRDWGYNASRDTSLKGSWQLEGMVAADGSWKTAEAWKPVDTTTMMSDSTAMIDDAAANTQAMNNSPQTASTKKTFGGSLYDTSMHYFDTAAFRQTLADRIKPFEYWKRLPELNIKPTLGVFTGNTGCNMMNGSFNFSGTDIKFDNNLRTSKMACNEYDESVFVSSLLKVDNYMVNNGMLELKQGDKTLLTFRKKNW